MFDFVVSGLREKIKSVVGLVSEPDRARWKFCPVSVIFLEVRDDLEYLFRDDLEYLFRHDLEYLFRHDLGYLSIRNI